MKKITIAAFLLYTGLSALAQVSFEASSNYGKLENITYDAHIENTMYAATQGNHIVVSTDNGANWTLFYSYPGSPFLSNLKMLPGNNALSFSTGDAIHFLDLATHTVTASFPVPPSNVPDAGASYISSYSVFDAAGTTILVDTGFSVGFANFGKTFFTEDGGANWAEIYYTLDNNNIFVNNVAISPSDSKKLFLARGNGDTELDGGLLISEDSGATWAESIAGIPVDQIAFNPSDDDDIFVGTGISFGEYPENLYHSTDNGATWNPVSIAWTDETLNNITKIVFNQPNPNKMILLEENEIARSSDGGATWQNTVYPVGLSMDYYYGLNASYNPFNENEVAISTDLFPQFSTDGGATLSQIHAKFYNVISTSIGKYGSDVHLYYGSNGGRLHKNIATGVTDAYEIEQPDSFNPKKNYMIADPAIPGRVFTYASMGFFGGNVNVSSDYGATKTNIFDSFADDIQELTIDPNNSNIIYISMRSGEGGSMTKLDITDLGNVIATDITTPEVNEFGDGVVTGIAINPANSNEVYIAKRTKVFKSVDGGTNWVEKTSGLESIVEGSDLIWDMAINPLNPAQMTVASNIGIFTTVDSAENWTSLLPNIDVRRVKHSPLNDGVLVGSVFANINELASIVYSVDNGDNWSTITQSDLNYVQSYAMDYDFEANTINAYIATTDLGILKYTIDDLELGIHNPAMNNNPIGVYPNPCTSQLNIVAANNIEISSVTVFSMTGQKVLESNALTLNVSSLSKGIYLVKATSASGKSFMQKFVKE
ncbi:MAG TPA: T9SS type A sorting domain-containing protein [Flavobacterium sp.]|nr:T9SS type A sorting domain-containing protein [Flavobacterium sp.]